MTAEEQIFFRHVGKKVVIDSNLLLVLLTGRVDIRLFGRFERVKHYSLDDFEFLERFLSRFTALVTTPHILTEVGNLANKLPEYVKPDWYRIWSSLISDKKPSVGFLEIWSPVAELSSTTEFGIFGITDAAIRLLANQFLVITDDRRLHGVMRKQGLPVLNFRDMRDVNDQFAMARV